MATRLLLHLQDIRTTVKAVASVASKAITKQRPLGKAFARPVLSPIQVCMHHYVQLQVEFLATICLTLYIRRKSILVEMGIIGL
jgi:hypothetical protein